MEIKKIVSYEMDQNCYILTDSGKGILIDPGPDTEKIKNEIKDIDVGYILLTHCHFDHLYSLNSIRGSKMVLASRECSNNMLRREISLCDNLSLPDASCDKILEDNEEINLYGIKIRCIKTPGHTDGSVCYLIDDILFSGDTLFLKSIGRCDLPTGNYNTLLNSVKEKLYTLDENVKVLPGHGEETSIGFEKKNNAFIRL